MAYKLALYIGIRSGNWRKFYEMSEDKNIVSIKHETFNAVEYNFKKKYAIHPKHIIAAT